MSDLTALGTGRTDDRLDLATVRALLVRALAWIHPVRWHVGALVALLAALAIVLLPPGALLFDVMWTRVFQGAPLTALQARMLGFDPAVTVDVPRLSAEMRHAIAVRALAAWALFGLPAMLLGTGLWYYQLTILQWVNQHLRLALFDRLQTLSLRFHGDARIGDAVYRLYQDSAMVTQLVQTLVLIPLYGVGRFAFSVVIVGAADPLLALLLLAAWPPAVALGWAAARRLRRRFRSAREGQSDVTASVHELLAGLRTVKAYGAEPWALARFTADSEQAFGRAFAARALLVVFEVGVFVTLGAALIAATALATWATRGGTPLFATRVLALAGFAAWNLGAFQFIRNHLGNGTVAGRLLWTTWGQAQDVAIGLGRTLALLDQTPEVRDAPAAVDLPPPRERLEFAGVSFAYASGRPALHDVTFTAGMGTITAIVGPSGAGKSTLVGLLLRLFDPGAGAISIDGLDLRRVRIASLRRQVAIALQEPLLSDASVRDNIRYAAPHASDAEIREAARIACADAFVAALPAGYDTIVGERGVRLSAGERQRIAIARAVLKGAPILVLDEPTASLDAATEVRLLENLAAWGRARIVLVVTHRLSAMRHADQIVVLDQGRLVERGTPAALLDDAHGVYRRMIAAEAAGLAP